MEHRALDDFRCGKILHSLRVILVVSCESLFSFHFFVFLHLELSYGNVLSLTGWFIFTGMMWKVQKEREMPLELKRGILFLLRWPTFLLELEERKPTSKAQHPPPPPLKKNPQKKRCKKVNNSILTYCFIGNYTVSKNNFLSMSSLSLRSQGPLTLA